MVTLIMDARVKPAHDAEYVASLNSSDSIFKQPTLRRPYSLRPRVGRLPLFSPAKSRGDGAPSGAPVFSLAAPSFQKDAGASRRSIAAISVPRVRVSRSTSPVSFGFHAAGSTPRRASAIGRPGRPCPASSSQSGRSTARSVPEARGGGGSAPPPRAAPPGGAGSPPARGRARPAPPPRAPPSPPPKTPPPTAPDQGPGGGQGRGKFW